MPSYDIVTTAFAIGSSTKWVDNVTAQHTVPGVMKSGRGSSRQFLFDGVVALQIALTLSRELQMSAWRAVQVATVLLESPDHTAVLSGGVILGVDVPGVTEHVRGRLQDAVESVQRPRRGRPRYPARGDGTPPRAD